MRILIRPSLFLIMVNAVAAISADAQQPTALTEQQMSAMKRSMQREIWPYVGFENWTPDPRDAGVFIERLVGGWQHGMPQQLLDVIPIAPGHFAPAVRDRLMRLPPTFDEYLIDQRREMPLYSVTAPENRRPSGPEAERLLVVAKLLGREHAEPILREYAGAVWPLTLEAERRYRAIEGRWEAEWDRLGRPVGDAMDTHETLRILKTQFRFAMKVENNLTGAWTRAVSTAGRLGSPIFVDDVIAMLGAPEPAERRIGSWMTRYVLNFADERPDAVAALRAAEQRLAASGVESDLKAAAAIRNAFDPKPTPGLPPPRR